jgi:hypothetical protein
MRHRLLLGCLVLAPLFALRMAWPSDPLPQFPRLVLWAWETPQDLRFVPLDRAGIAFLARTVWLGGSGAHSRPRLQPLRYSPGAALMAVVRMESPETGLAPVSDAVRETVPAARIEGVRALQVDFDARESQREWYRAFLVELRAAMPRGVPLTITALESWCEEGRWVRGLPVADATPMLFRLGPGEIANPSSFPVSLCSSSVGVSTDELPVRIPSVSRIYFFHPGPWTREAYDAAAAQAARWRR